MGERSNAGGGADVAWDARRERRVDAVMERRHRAGAAFVRIDAILAGRERSLRKDDWTSIEDAITELPDELQLRMVDGLQAYDAMTNRTNRVSHRIWSEYCGGTGRDLGVGVFWKGMGRPPKGNVRAEQRGPYIALHFEMLEDYQAVSSELGRAFGEIGVGESKAEFHEGIPFLWRDEGMGPDGTCDWIPLILVSETRAREFGSVEASLAHERQHFINAQFRRAFEREASRQREPLTVESRVRDELFALLRDGCPLCDVRHLLSAVYARAFEPDQRRLLTLRSEISQVMDALEPIGWLRVSDAGRALLTYQLQDVPLGRVAKFADAYANWIARAYPDLASVVPRDGSEPMGSLVVSRQLEPARRSAEEAERDLRVAIAAAVERIVGLDPLPPELAESIRSKLARVRAVEDALATTPSIAMRPVLLDDARTNEIRTGRRPDRLARWYRDFVEAAGLLSAQTMERLAASLPAEEPYGETPGSSDLLASALQLNQRYRLNASIRPWVDVDAEAIRCKVYAILPDGPLHLITEAELRVPLPAGAVPKKPSLRVVRG